MSSTPAVDIVVPLWNSERWLEGCLGSLAAQTLPARRTVVVDDGSTDGTVAWLAANAPQVRLERLPRHRGFAAAVNRGIELTEAPLVALLNVDTLAAPTWLEELAGGLATAPPGVGFAASKMLQMGDPGRIDDAGDDFSRFGSATKRGRGAAAERWTRQERITSASAGAALYRREMLDEIGLFDESYDSYLEDVDLGLRAQLAGWGCLFVPTAEVLHAGGGSALGRERYVRLVTANRAATIVKNIPARLLWRHAVAWIWGQFYFLVAYRRPGASWLGYWDLLRRLPSLLRRRRDIQRRRRLSDDDFDRLLAVDLGEPPLRQLVWRRLRRR